MILVDTSVWVDHLRQGNARLANLLGEAQVVGHPFVTGEVTLGHLRNPGEIVALLERLPQAVVIPHDEVLQFVREHKLAGSGLGWVDVHLLSSAAAARSRLWTLDRRLAAASSRLGCGM